MAWRSNSHYDAMSTHYLELKIDMSLVRTKSNDNLHSTYRHRRHYENDGKLLNVFSIASHDNHVRLKEMLCRHQRVWAIEELSELTLGIMTLLCAFFLQSGIATTFVVALHIETSKGKRDSTLRNVGS